MHKQELNLQQLKTLKKQLKNNKNYDQQLSKILKEQTNKKYLEENKFVLFNVISKKANNNMLTGVRTSIGYLLPNNNVYDFISKQILEVYELDNINNNKKNGEYALIKNITFENSKRKIRINDKNLQSIELLFKKYIEEYRLNENNVKSYAMEIYDEEHIPTLKM